MRLAQRGVRIFAGLDADAAAGLQRTVGATPIVLDDPRSVLPLTDSYPGPIASVLSEAQLAPGVSLRVELDLVTYILGPATTPDPAKPGWLLRDTMTGIAAGALLKGI